MNQYYCIVTFHTTNHALNFEKELKQQNINVKLMPVPRQVSSSCGTAAEFPCEMQDDILDICNKFHIEIDEVHKIENKKNNTWFSKFLKSKE
ncbi:DUF3343 domain-containing protein [Brassicibacter mesophilus]|uniref:DUF3343 domain-containing protein n=1 Tax=Brassicibacter mesophilus TaxID=745119 RepID=UPI003D1B6A0E